MKVIILFRSIQYIAMSAVKNSILEVQKANIRLRRKIKVIS